MQPHTTHTTNNANNQVQFGGVATVLGRTNIAAAGAVPDTHALTTATVEKIRAAIVASAGHPLVVAATRRALADAGIKDWANHTAVALAIWDWVRGNVRFVQDDDVLRAQLGLPNELELLIEPPVLLSMSNPAGDCDDFTMLTGAMCLSAGIPMVEVCTVMADPTDPGRWSHVYLYARLGGGHQLTLDCSHGEHLGWEVPQYYQRKGWGMFGGPSAALNEHIAAVTAQGAQMHGLEKFPGGVAPAWRRQRNRYNTPGALDTGKPIWAGIQPRAGMGAFDWGAFATQVTTGTFDVIKQVTQKPGQYIQGGTISSSVPGAQPYPGGGINITTPIGGGSVGAGISTEVLMLGGLGLLALVLFKR